MKAVADKDQALEQINEFHPLSDDNIKALESYVSLLIKWNKKINLVSKTTIDTVWTRHILDSAQLVKFIPEGVNSLTDFGSGAGLPAIILAILTDISEIYLIESNGRKSSFLHEVANAVGVNITIYNERAEDLNPWKSDVITARAFAPLDKLLDYIFPFTTKDSLCILSKGCNVHQEIEKAQENWLFNFELSASISGVTDSNDGDSVNAGYILELNNLMRNGTKS